VGLHREFSDNLGIAAQIEHGPQFDHVAYVDGLENPSENYHNIVGWLVKHGYSDGDIQTVIGGNILRALGKIW
jgi:membrane dipeptidase